MVAFSTHQEEMQCSVKKESDRNCGNIIMKNINSYKNHYKKVGLVHISLLLRCLSDVSEQDEATQVALLAYTAKSTCK